MIVNRIIHNLLLIISFLIISDVQGQNIVNASFEDWVDSCAVDQPPIGWTTWSVNDGPDQRGPNCIGNIPAFDGLNFMCLRWASGGASLSEGVATEITDLVVGESYSISFYTRPDDYWSYAEEIFFMFYLDSVYLENSQPVFETGNWHEVAFHFTASDTAHQISFQVTDGGGTCAFAALVVDNMTISKVSGLEENYLQDKTLVHVLDLMGKETENRPNTLLLYVYSDGTTEKVFRVE